MIYLDNAATTMQKPAAVAEAVTAALQSFGGVGRGVHGASIGAGMSVYMARAAVAKLLGAPNASRVAFGINATEALNTAIMGLMNPGDVAVTTAASHNSVLRPLFRLRDEQDCEIRIAAIDEHGQLDWDSYLGLLGVREQDGEFVCADSAEAAEGVAGAPVKLVVATHSSNLTGDIYDAPRMAAAAHAAGALFILDAAQTAGVVSIDMAKDGYDVVCFTGHKSLYGPQGTGGLAVAEGVEIRPLKEGGSGMKSYEERQPEVMPERLEAGTLNAHGLAGLAAGVAYVQEHGVDQIRRQIQQLTKQLEDSLRAIPGVVVYGGVPEARTGVVAFNVGEIDSALVADVLSNEYQIATRAGAHCAPLMHQALGTVNQGAVRMSLSSFTTEEDISAAVAAVRAIAQEMCHD